METDVDGLHDAVGGRVDDRDRPAHRNARATIDDHRNQPVGEIARPWYSSAPVADVHLGIVRRYKRRVGIGAHPYLREDRVCGRIDDGHRVREIQRDVESAAVPIHLEATWSGTGNTDRGVTDERPVGLEL